MVSTLQQRGRKNVMAKRFGVVFDDGRLRANSEPSKSRFLGKSVQNCPDRTST